MTFYLSFT